MSNFDLYAIRQLVCRLIFFVLCGVTAAYGFVAMATWALDYPDRIAVTAFGGCVLIAFLFTGLFRPIQGDTTMNEYAAYFGVGFFATPLVHLLWQPSTLADHFGKGATVLALAISALFTLIYAYRALRYTAWGDFVFPSRRPITDGNARGTAL